MKNQFEISSHLFPRVVFVESHELSVLVRDVDMMQIPVIPHSLVVPTADEQVECLFLFPLQLGHRLVDAVHFPVRTASHGNSNVPSRAYVSHIAFLLDI